MLQPEFTSSKSSSFPITADGGIIKIPLLEKPDGSKINWIRGMNAQFYYTAHAYIIPQEHDNKMHSEHCSSGCSHSQKDKDELLLKKVELMQQLLDQAKSIIRFHVEKKKKEEIPVTLDPSKKPVRTLISNSTQNDPNPFDLRIGYSFSVTAMEICVKSLKVGEKARFLCMPDYCEGFMQLETVMRQEKINKKLKSEGKPPISVSGCCAHASPELLEITRGLEPAIGAPLEFEIHLVGVQDPNSFQKQIWEMEPFEKYQEIPLIKSQGGQEYNKGDYNKALEKYERCLVLLESLSTSSIILDLKKQDMDLKRGVVYESIIPPDNKIELDVFNKLFTTCRLNYAACQLKLKNYTSVIEQCSMVLNTEPENQKALFRRGQAYIQHGMHLDLAERDLSCLQSFLDEQSVEYGECQKWKKVLQQKMEVYRAKERKMYGSMFS